MRNEPKDPRLAAVYNGWQRRKALLEATKVKTLGE